MSYKEQIYPVKMLGQVLITSTRISMFVLPVPSTSGLQSSITEDVKASLYMHDYF